MKNNNPQALLKGLQLFQKAQQLHAAKAYAGAADAYRQALLLMPEHPQLLINYGKLAEEVKDWAGAEKIYRRLATVKDIPDLDGKIAEALYNQDRNEEAIPLFTTFVQRNPGDAVASRLLATCLFRSMCFEEAIRVARSSWETQHHPDTISLLIAIYLELGDGDALAPLVDEALRRYPDDWQVQKLAAEHLLKAGDYLRGFRYFPAMRSGGDGGRHYVEGIDLPWWDGQPFAGKVLIGGEQGIGDEILTACFFSRLVNMGQAAVIEADERLLALFRAAFPALEFVPRKQRVLQTLAEAGGPLKKTICGNLGELFSRMPGWQPPAAPWLKADPRLAARFRADYHARWPDRHLVGVSWKSQRVMKSGARKDIRIESLQPLLEQAGAQFINLQYGNVADDIATLPDPARIFVDPEVDTMNDMDSLFAQIAALDLVITTSNVTAHIAGAIGKPCWVILPRARPVIWYWGYRGERTPWYPATRLFRNEREDDWQALLARIADALRQTLAQAPARP